MPDANLTSHLTADEIECALVTIAELWCGVDESNLSDRQNQVGDRLAGIWTEQQDDAFGDSAEPATDTTAA